MRKFTTSVAAAVWRSVFHRTSAEEWTASTSGVQHETILSPPSQNALLAAEADRQVKQQVGSGDAPLSVHRLVVGDGGDAHHQSPPPSESDAASVEHAGRSSQPGTFTNGSAIYPVKEEVPDLAVPLYKDGTGEEGLTAVAECQDDNTLLKDLSAVKVTKDGPESLQNRGTRRALIRLQEQQQKAATKMRKVAEQSQSERRKLANVLGAQNPSRSKKDPHDNEGCRTAMSQRVCQGKQQKIAELKEQITAAQNKFQKYQSEMQALKTQDSVPEDLLKAQEELEATERAEVKRLQMKLSEMSDILEAEATKDLKAKSSKPISDVQLSATPAGDRIMAVHTKPAEAPAEMPPKPVIAISKEQPKKPPLSKRQLDARAAQAKPKQVKWKPQTTEDFLRVVAKHESESQPKSKHEAEAPQEMTAEEVEGLAELLDCSKHYYPDLFKRQKQPLMPTRKQAPPKSTPVLSAEQAALQRIAALYDVLVQAWEAGMKRHPAKVFIHSLVSNRGPHGELMFLLPRMEETRRPHEVMKIDFHTPAIIRNAGRTLAARDVVDILRVYIGVLHRVVGHFLPAEGVTIVTGRGDRTGARTFKAVGTELAQLKAEGVFLSDFYAHTDEGAYTIFIKSTENRRKKGKR